MLKAEAIFPPPEEKQREHGTEYMLGALVESPSEMAEKLLMQRFL
jgi:hypothetical protein